MKVFTGDINKYFKCRNFLLDQGFSVVNAIHIGEDKYEFTENPWDCRKGGCNDTHTILAWIDGEEVKYRAKVTGWYCLD